MCKSGTRFLHPIELPSKFCITTAPNITLHLLDLFLCILFHVLAGDVDLLCAGHRNTANQCADYNTYILKRLCHNLYDGAQKNDP